MAEYNPYQSAANPGIVNSATNPRPFNVPRQLPPGVQGVGVRPFSPPSVLPPGVEQVPGQSAGAVRPFAPPSRLPPGVEQPGQSANPALTRSGFVPTRNPFSPFSRSRAHFSGFRPAPAPQYPVNPGAQPVNPVNPVNSAGVLNPVNPVNPGAPVNPVNPVTTVSGNGSSYSANPVRPLVIPTRSGIINSRLG